MIHTRNIIKCAVLILIALSTSGVYAQTELNIEPAAATSTPFQIQSSAETEESRTRALISQDRPKLYSFVELEEDLKDEEIRQHQVEYKLQNMARKRTDIERRMARRDAQVELAILNADLSEVEIGTKISLSNESQTRALQLSATIIELDTITATDKKMMPSRTDSHRSALDSTLFEVINEADSVDKRINKLEAKLRTTGQPTKIARLEKQLANEQLRARRLDERVFLVNRNIDEWLQINK